MEMVPRIELVSVDLRNSVPSQTVLDLRVTEGKNTLFDIAVVERSKNFLNTRNRDVTNID